MEDYSQYLKLINNCDPQDPYLSETSLGKCLSLLPLNHIKPIYLNDSCLALNVEQLIPTDNGLARDYRGLAELMQFNTIEVDSKFKRSRNQTRTLIDAFIYKNLNSMGNCNFSLNDLIKFIERIERFDVIDDLMPTLIKLAHNLEDNQRQPIANNPQALALQRDHRINHHRLEQLTIDDTPQATTNYDAFICYAPEDFKYAEELTALLEGHDARVAKADDLLPGRFEHDALLKVIESRCRKVIVILTPNFLESKECEFQSQFASEYAIKAGLQNLIPLIYEPCDERLVPNVIKHMSKIDLTNPRSKHWQIKKLIRSLELSNAYESGLAARSYDGRQSPGIVIENSPQYSNHLTSISGMSSGSNLNGGPIIDLLHSQTSDAMSFNTQSTCSNNIQEIPMGSAPMSTNHSPIAGSSSSKLSQTFNGWINRFKSFKQNQSNNVLDPSTSSRMNLIPSDQSIDDGNYSGNSLSTS